MQGNMSNGVKRSVDELNSGSASPQTNQSKKMRKAIVITELNAVLNLNEINRGIIYKVESQSGPPHAPRFTVSIEFDGEKLVADGKSKKHAKANVAVEAFRKLILKSGRTCNFIMESKPLKNPFISNSTNMAAPKKISNGTKVSQPVTQDKNVKQKQKITADKNPISLINELYNNAIFKVDLLETKNNLLTFQSNLTVNGTFFIGTGNSKKAAKTSAAKEALARLFSLSYSPLNKVKLLKGIELDQVYANIIGTLVTNKYNELIVGYPEQHTARKVLAGIVMTKNMDFDNATVITLTTGTKVLGGESLSLNGTVLNDLHAEIVSRRCFQKYLYSEVRKFLNKEIAYDTIFEVSINTRDDFKLKLKNGIQFHLYISTAPCGDSAVFSPRETSEITSVEEDKNANRKTRGLLRTKIESGEGTIPVRASIQTWDGILLGQRVLTMSCSDKVARWNVLGLQGSLLAAVIHPIYLHSIVLGNLLHPVHTYRAIGGRIEDSIKNLPADYRLNKPYLAMTTSTERRNPVKSPNFSLNWTIEDQRIEIVSCTTGRTVENGISELSKIKFFKRYEYLIKKIPQYYMRQKMITDQIINYAELKLYSTTFQAAKTELFEAFKTKDLGNWLKKPMEQDQFYSNAAKFF